MRPFLTLWSKELLTYFRSATAYVVLSVFLVVVGLSFWTLAADSVQNPVGWSMMLFGPVFFWLMVLVMVTVITMRLFAEERRAGTFETLVTTPVGDVQIVLAKYFGALFFFVFATSLPLSFIPAVRLLTGDASPVDWGPVAAGYLILVLAGGFYLSIGLFVSAVTRSQVAAAILSFLILGLLFFVESFGHALPWRPVREWLTTVATSRHVLQFASGLVDTRAIVFYLTGVVLMLFATIKVIESERGR